MKKILLITLVLVVTFSLAGMAMARSPKAPKVPANICFTALEKPIEEFSLLIKPMGTIKLSDGPKKLYSIQGLYYSIDNGPGTVSGSGYMDGAVFHFSLYGTYTWQGLCGSYQADGYWNVSTEERTMYSVWNNSVNFTWTLVEVACKEQ